MNKSLIDHAIDWAKQGVPVFPCGANKAPLTEKGFYDAVTDPTEVRRLFEFFGDQAQMIGGRMGKEAGLFAVDVDLYKGEAPRAWLKAAIDEGALVDTRVHETKNGGLHFLFESADYFPNLNPAKGVEVKGDGGYIILPGTPGYTVKTTGIATAPTRLLERLRYAERNRSDQTVSALEGNVLSGEDFHSSLTQLASKLAFQGRTLLEIQSHLRKLMEASVASAPGHDRHARWRAIYEDRGGEFTRVVKSGYRKYSDDGGAEEFEELLDVDQLMDDAELVFPGVRDRKPDEIIWPVDEWPFHGYGYFADQEHDLQTQEFVMFPIYAENETVVIFAEPKTGKTAIALTTALHIACGMDYGGFKVAAGGPTLYYALEGSRAIRLRVAAWKKTQKEAGIELPERIPAFVVERPVNFLKEDQRVASVAQIVAANEYSKKFGSPLKAIFIDTLTKAMAGGDQNSVEDTSHLFELVNLLRGAGITATIVFVHHKARGGNVRGSTNIEAEPDMLIDVSKKGETVCFKIARARSIEDGLRFYFELKGVDLGKTVQGHPLAGVIATPVEAPVEDTEAVVSEHLLMEDVVNARTAIVELGVPKVSVKNLMLEMRMQNTWPDGMKEQVSSAEVQKFMRQIANKEGVVFRDRFMIQLAENKTGTVADFLVRKIT